MENSPKLGLVGARVEERYPCTAHVCWETRLHRRSRRYAHLWPRRSINPQKNTAVSEMNQPEALPWRRQLRVPQPPTEPLGEEAGRFNARRHTEAAFCCFYVSRIDRLFQVQLIRTHTKDKMAAKNSACRCTGAPPKIKSPRAQLSCASLCVSSQCAWLQCVF